MQGYETPARQIAQGVQGLAKCTLMAADVFLRAKPGSPVMGGGKQWRAIDPIRQPTFTKPADLARLRIAVVDSRVAGVELKHALMPAGAEDAGLRSTADEHVCTCGKRNCPKCRAFDGACNEALKQLALQRLAELDPGLQEELHTALASGDRDAQLPVLARVFDASRAVHQGTNAEVFGLEFLSALVYRTWRAVKESGPQTQLVHGHHGGGKVRGGTAPLLVGRWSVRTMFDQHLACV